jgi:hypothetical protein
MIRQARSLFAPKVLKFLGTLRLPAPLPFSAVEFFPRESMRYTSRIDAGVLMRQAREELAESDPDSFLAMLLALAAGLRRGRLTASCGAMSISPGGASSSKSRSTGS